VLVVVRVRDLEEALQLVNTHEYGNGAAIFTRDGAAARHFCHGVLSGMVGVNVPIPVPMAFHSFGGWKRSLSGSLHMHGPDGVRFYTRLKTITARWPESAAARPDFFMPT
jgi:malonate-semialdehyde dehydrogenase (acetylating)/methylmalonate-semialdehyde dehydrogenase